MKGSFYKRGNTWSFMIDIGKDPATGERRQKGKGGFKTKKEAQAAAALLHAELTKGTYVEESKHTFEEVATKWMEAYKNTGRVKDGTVRIRTHEMGRLMPYFAKLLIKNISTDMYQNALIDLKKSGLADNTLSGIHSTGRMIFKHGQKIHAISHNPTDHSYVPKSKKSVDDIENKRELPKYLEKDMLVKFLNTASEFGLERDYEMFRVLAYTGMRVGELCALKWKDIDFEEGTISITKTLYNPNNNYSQFKLNTPKTKNSIRTIEVEDEILEDLKNLKTIQDVLKGQKKNSYFDQDFVFAKVGALAGYPEVIKMVELRMKRLLKLAELNEDLSPHSLRHTHTSLLAEAEVTLEQIMDRLGHGDDEVTRLIYLHITKPKKKEASQKFAELMRNL